SIVSEVSIFVQGEGGVNVAGRLVERSGDSSYDEMTLMLYPAVYELTPVESKYSTFEATDLVVGQFFSSAMVEYLPTTALFDDLRAEVAALVAACLTATTIDPEGCPFGTYSWGVVGDVTWTLKENPTVDREYFYGDSFDAGGGVVTASYREEWFGETTDEVV